MVCASSICAKYCIPGNAFSSSSSTELRYICPLRRAVLLICTLVSRQCCADLAILIFAQSHLLEARQRQFVDFGVPNKDGNDESNLVQNHEETNRVAIVSSWPRN